MIIIFCLGEILLSHYQLTESNKLPPETDTGDKLFLRVYNKLMYSTELAITNYIGKSPSTRCKFTQVNPKVVRNGRVFYTECQSTHTRI